MSLNFSRAEFVRSAADPSGFPDDDRPRCVFVGRSNVGKSSTLNTLVGRKNLARVSAVPGKTILVNLFLIDGRLWLVDLPGYGFSKTSKETRARYSRLAEEYLTADMEKIKRVYMIVDARHEPTQGDKVMMGWIRAHDLPVTVIANKIDKLGTSRIEAHMTAIRQGLALGDDARVLPFSAERKTNREALLADLEAAEAGEE